MPKIKLKVIKGDIVKVRTKISQLESLLKKDFTKLGGSTEENAMLGVIELRKNVTIQKFASTYKPLKGWYRKSKSDKGQSIGFWQKTYAFVTNLNRWPFGKSWVAGIEGGKIADYAKLNEFGGLSPEKFYGQQREIPSRPLFVPTALEFQPTNESQATGSLFHRNWIISVKLIIKRTWRA